VGGFAQGLAADPRPGQTLGDYTLKQLLGRGGMGVVFLAEHRRLGRNVALKLLAPALAQSDVVRERFVRESRRAAAIDHPNIIPVFEANEVEGNLFIAMRYVAGPNLRQLLQADAPLGADRAVRLVGQVGSALDAAHSVGLVHRDVKPANVMVDGQAGAGSEHCYLTDFGLTKDISSSTGFTDTGQFVGTIQYVAPEQIENRALDARTDIYALGCVLYELLTEEVPFPRDSDMAVMFAHMNEPPPRPSAVRPEVGDAMDHVIARAMAKSQGDRHGSCAELVAEARDAMGG
jgi:serine/threonine-protein kinase